MFDQTFLRLFDGKIAEQFRLLLKFGVDELQINKVWEKMMQSVAYRSVKKICISNNVGSWKIFRQ